MKWAVGSAHLGKLAASSEEFVASGNLCIELMDSGPYVQAVGRGSLQNSVRTEF